MVLSKTTTQRIRKKFKTWRASPGGGMEKTRIVIAQKDASPKKP